MHQERVARTLLGPAHHAMLAPVSRCATVRGSARARRGEAFSKMEDGSDLGTCRPQVTSVGDLPASSGSAPQLIPESLGSGRRHPLYSTRKL